MKRFNHLLSTLLLLVSLSAAITACKHDTDTGNTPQPQPPAKTTITSVDPATAPVGSTITISGTNFSTNPASNTVTIGGVQATIVSATPTSIVVVVPAGAANGPVSVTSGGQTAQSPGTFTVAPTPPGPLKSVVEVQSTIYANTTWTKDKTYLLRGMVYIPANYTLTIEPGTVIRGAGPEQDPNGKGMAGTLIIERLGKIIAKGTAAEPIVFTSAKAAGQRNYGDWGGVVLIGKAAINRPGATILTGGVRGTVETYGEFDDNSGVLQYVRIEYAGAAQPPAPATKLSGLTLIGVGNTTIIDHVQVSYSGSDAFSWFGGTINGKNLISYRSFDDDWSVGWGYVGNVQFGVSLRDPAVADPSGSNGFEVENYEPAETADVPPVVLANGLQQTATVFANISNFASGTTPSDASSAGRTGAGIYLRRNSAISIYNSLFYGYPQGLQVESMGSASSLMSGAIDLKGIVLANTLTPIAGGGVITSDQATAYFTGAGRANQVILSSDLASLLLNGATFSLNAPNFLPQPNSPLLTGAGTGGRLANSFFTPVSYRGAFGTENWLTNWTNFTPQTTNYDR